MTLTAGGVAAELEAMFLTDPPVRCTAREVGDRPDPTRPVCTAAATWDMLWRCASGKEWMSHVCDRHKVMLGEGHAIWCDDGHAGKLLVVHPRNTR